MIRVQLTQGKLASIDLADLPLIVDCRWQAMRTRNTWYAVTTPSVLMHRVLLGLPAGTNVDHVNGDGLDNRRANLRAADHSQNSANRHTPRAGRLGVSGVSPDGKYFRARIIYRKKTYYLGRFETLEAAALAYAAKARELQGEYVSPLLPDPTRSDWSSARRLKRKPCSIEGCARAHAARGYCDAHYRRLLAHGDPLGGRRSPSEGGPKR